MAETLNQNEWAKHCSLNALLDVMVLKLLKPIHCAYHIVVLYTVELDYFTNLLHDQSNAANIPDKEKKHGEFALT